MSHVSALGAHVTFCNSIHLGIGSAYPALESSLFSLLLRERLQSHHLHLLSKTLPNLPDQIVQINPTYSS